MSSAPHTKVNEAFNNVAIILTESNGDSTCELSLIPMLRKPNMSTSKYLIFLLFLNFYAVVMIMAEDYYELLGISRDADNREIRKSYKKLALQYHPDKNKDNEEIQEMFVKINKAYEVLKDTETRRKYDQFGEAGLEDSQGFGHHYESWSFYENFGIYDDDQEIITLSESDFSQLVVGRSDVWFINYYSPRCSHCHHLAPVWRKVAQELLGVVRFGAINCGEEWILCRQQGIQSFPTLKFYPKGVEYRGERTTEHLIDFVLKSISVKYIQLNQINLKNYLSDPNIFKLSWLIFVCFDDDDEECPSEITRLKLTVMLRGIANVAVIEHNAEFAKTIAKSTGTVYFEPNKINKESGKVITSSDAREIFEEVLDFLPQIKEISSTSVAELAKRLEKGRNSALLLCFISENNQLDKNLNLLQFLLSNTVVRKINCDTSVGVCNDLHVHKYPSFVVMKTGGKYEVFHGRVTPSDIAVFVEDSLSSTVESLGPNDFPDRVIDRGEPWFVDFYAPWCPPCLRLLPEWRKASQEIGDIVNFGTVDCTIHHNLCNQYKIHSYPTTVLYNQTVPHKYDGKRNFMDIVEFVKDTLSPPVISLTYSSFKKLVEGRSPSETWVIDFFAPWCGPCQQLSPQYRKLSKMLSSLQNLHIAQVDCTSQIDLCDSQTIRSYPTIRLYPVHRQPFVSFDSYNRDLFSLRAWIFKFLATAVIELDNNDFYNKVIYNSDKWIIDFYAPWCSHCELFAPDFEIIAMVRYLKPRVRFKNQLKL
ncbi:hypothetical protein CHUAL_005464 [Chamberlinius hualienensis]